MRSELHKELQEIAKAYAISKTYWICGDEVPMPFGVCDVWGMSRSKQCETMAIEVKVSREDFRSDSQKLRESLTYPLGNYQYIFCPENLIFPHEIHEKWGLIWWNGKKVVNKKRAPLLEMTAQEKLDALLYFLNNGTNVHRPKLVDKVLGE